MQTAKRPHSLDHINCYRRAPITLPLQWRHYDHRQRDMLYMLCSISRCLCGHTVYHTYMLRSVMRLKMLALKSRHLPSHFKPEFPRKWERSTTCAVFSILLLIRNTKAVRYSKTWGRQVCGSLLWLWVIYKIAECGTQNTECNMWHDGNWSTCQAMYITLVACSKQFHSLLHAVCR